VDATTVAEPGATGTDWRIHYSIGLPEMRCDFYAVTDRKGAETYKRIPVQEGDVILGDRGYCHREGVAHVLRAQGDVLVRLNSTSFPLLDAKEDVAFDILAHLQRPGQRWIASVSAYAPWGSLTTSDFRPAAQTSTEVPGST
jgi:hypothetical protein